MKPYQVSLDKNIKDTHVRLDETPFFHGTLRQTNYEFKMEKTHIILKTFIMQNNVKLTNIQN